MKTRTKQHGENLTVKQVRMDAAPETKQFPVILPLEHHETIRRIAFDRRITMAEIVREAVREWIEKQPK